MSATTYSLTFDGSVLRRGFWLYIWEITRADKTTVYYVGRTGDSSSVNAQSPFNRMGQHLGFNKKSNVLRKTLSNKGIAPEECNFHLIVHGPILEEAKDRDNHRERRDIIAAQEKALAEALCAAGYTVLNTVKCRRPLDKDRFAAILEAFATHFPRLRADGKS